MISGKRMEVVRGHRCLRQLEPGAWEVVETTIVNN